MRQRSNLGFWSTAALALALIGCAQPAATPVGTPTPAVTPSDAASATPSDAASGGPSAGPTASASPGAPAATPTPSFETGVLSGTVMDGKLGFVPDGTKVHIESLDKSRPFSVDLETASGQYAVNNVPQNAQVAVTVSRDGWTTRRRVGVVVPYDPRLLSPNVLNFGGKTSDANRTGLPYFLSPNPEIALVSPTDQDASLPADQLTFKLTMSEPLDAENRRRLAAAFRIVPNSPEAISEDSSLPASVQGDAELEGLRIGGAAPADQVIRYAFRQNSGFLNGVETSSFTWDAENKTATFTLKAPLKTDREDEAEYAFFLVQSTDDPIEDGDGNPMGTDEEGKFGQTTLGEIIYNAIAEPSLTLSEGFDDEEERWADTHLSFSRFSVEADATAPTVASVVARRNYVDDANKASDRIEITFSEPMVAFPRIYSRSLLSLNNYVIATGETESEVGARDIGPGKGANAVTPSANATTFRDALGGSNAVVIDSNRQTEGDFAIELSVRDPKTVIIKLPAGSFPLDANYVRVIAGAEAADDAGDGAVADPAGNGVSVSGGSRVGELL